MNKLLPKFGVVFILLFLSIKGNGSVILLTSSSEDFQIPSSEMDIFQDKDGRIKFDDIRTANPATYSNITGKIPSEHGVHYWVRFSLKDTSGLSSWLLQLPLHTNLINLYFLDSSNVLLEKYTTGQSLPFYSRPIDTRTFTFELPLDKNKPLVVFAHIFNEKHTDLSFIVSKNKNYLEVHTKGYLFLGIIYGILFLMMIYNLILYFSIRDKIYLYYVLYVLSAAFFLTWKDGLGFQLLWPSIPLVNRYHHAVALFLLMVTYLYYNKEFLGVDKFVKNGKEIFYIAVSILVFHLMIAVFDNSYFEPFPIFYFISYVVLAIISVYLYWKKSFKPALYSILSIACIVFAFTIIKLRYWSLLEWNWFNEYILNYAIVAETIIMALAIKDKISFLKRIEQEAADIKMKEEQLLAESEYIQLRNVGLEWELKNQNNELAVLSEFLTQKTEFLDYIRKELETISDELKGNNSIKRLVKEIGREVDMEDHWEQFQVNFDKANNNFLSQIKSMYPVLKPADLLLCAYIKLGKSNKEIASLLNISISGVEKKRVRLKEKLNLENEMRLTDFILGFGHK